SAVLFDFDYTLADSSRGVIECINFALGELGIPPAVPQKIRHTIGLSLTDTFLRLVGKQYAEQSGEFVRLFIQRADEVMADMTVLYGEVDAVLKQIRAHHISTGIVSTKFRYRIENIMRRENLLHHFDVIVGGEDVSNHKPDPEGLLKAVSLLKCNPEKTIYIGDNTTDAETARRAGIDFAAVLGGVTRRQEFEKFDVLGILENLSGLAGFLSWNWIKYLKRAKIVC
ncbi:MAG: HAD-IA family hydrolase, partial [Calditrichia bacterium]